MWWWWRALVVTVFVGVFLHTCSAIYYAPGTTYHYEYSTYMSLAEPNAVWPKLRANQRGHSVGIRLQANIALTPLWQKVDKYGQNQQIIRMTVSDTQMRGTLQTEAKQPLPQLERHPIHFLWVDDSLVKYVYPADNDTDSVREIKFGIIALFQVKQNGTRQENAPNGHCKMDYKKEMSYIQKVQGECFFPTEEEQFSNVVPMQGVQQSSLMNSFYALKDDIIDAATCIHSTRFYISLEKSLKFEAVASQEMQIKKRTTSEEEMLHGDIPFEVISEYGKANNYNIPLRLTLAYGSSRKCKNCPKPADILNSNREALLPEHTGTLKTSEAFLSLVVSLRTVDEQTIVDILQDAANQDIILTLIDVVAATQTAVSHSALMKYVNFDDKSLVEVNERFLLASAFSTHPSTQLMKDLVALWERRDLGERIEKAVSVSMGAVLYTYARQEIRGKLSFAYEEKQDIEKLINQIEENLLARLAECTDSPCQLVLLQTLANAGLNSTAVPLMELVQKSADMSVVEACLKALRRMPADIFTDVNVRSPVEAIFFQTRRPYDSAVRSQALTQLLRTDLTQDDLLAIVMATTDSSNQEFALYTQARLLDLMSANATFREKMKSVLDDVNVANYNSFAPKGKSLAFSSTLANTMSVLAHYFMYVENGKSGVMKRSGMDVTVTGKNQPTMPISMFNIFSAGLEGMLGEEVPAGQEDVDPMAGMSLDLLGVGLPPITFFVGQTNLLSAVWSAPSSLQSALKANLMLQDSHRFYSLRNGFVLKIDIQGALSVDLSGSLSVSLWNKNAMSLIRNSGAVAIKASLQLDTPLVMASISHSATAENVIDFQTDVDFYSSVNLCLQMSQHGGAFSHNVTRFESLKGTKRGVRVNQRMSTKLPEVSFPLPQSNSRQCKTLLAEQ